MIPGDVCGAGLVKSGAVADWARSDSLVNSWGYRSQMMRALQNGGLSDVKMDGFASILPSGVHFLICWGGRASRCPKVVYVVTTYLT